MRTVFFASFLFLSLSVSSQSISSYLRLHYSNGAVDTVPISLLDSITHFSVINYGPCGGLTEVVFDGYTYPLIEIAGQCWFTENLRTTIYANGDAIPGGLSSIQWNGNLNGAYAIYNDSPIHEAVYGKLYNWHAVNDSRNICPIGFHIPTDAEWTILIDSLGGLSNAGGKMKTTGTQNWSSPNTGATNSSGFSGLPGGYRSATGSYAFRYFRGYWWSSTPENATWAWHYFLDNELTSVTRTSTSKGAGFSCRCIKN